MLKSILFIHLQDDEDVIFEVEIESGDSAFFNLSISSGTTANCKCFEINA